MKTERSLYVINSTGLKNHYSTSLVAQLVKKLPAVDADLGLIPELGRYPGQGKGYSLQYSGLENSMDCIVHGVTKSRTRLSDFHFLSLSFPYYKKKKKLS